MLTLSSKQQWGIGGVLLLVMLATRSHMVDHLQDASWAVFLLLGFYVRPLWAYALFWVAGFAVDYAVTSNGWIIVRSCCLHMILRFGNNDIVDESARNFYLFRMKRIGLR